VTTYMLTPHLFFGSGETDIEMVDIRDHDEATALLFFGATVRVPTAEDARQVMADMGMSAEEIQQRFDVAAGAGRWDGVALNEA
jgi:hypothetical protein